MTEAAAIFALGLIASVSVGGLAWVTVALVRRENQLVLRVLNRALALKPDGGRAVQSVRRMDAHTAPARVSERREPPAEREPEADAGITSARGLERLKDLARTRAESVARENEAELGPHTSPNGRP